MIWKYSNGWLRNYATKAIQVDEINVKISITITERVSNIIKNLIKEG